jgi:hypothetical protein
MSGDPAGCEIGTRLAVPDEAPQMNAFPDGTTGPLPGGKGREDPLHPVSQTRAQELHIPTAQHHEANPIPQRVCDLSHVPKQHMQTAGIRD